MKRKVFGVAGWLVLIVFPWIAGAAEESVNAGDYRKAVMNILKMHVKALEAITSGSTPYSDNVTRHAVAIRSTSQLLDHAYPGTQGIKDEHGNVIQPNWKDQASFHQLVQHADRASIRLVESAKKWQTGDRKAFQDALGNLKKSCRECHGVMREWP